MKNYIKPDFILTDDMSEGVHSGISFEREVVEKETSVTEKGVDPIWREFDFEIKYRDFTATKEYLQARKAGDVGGDDGYRHESQYMAWEYYFTAPSDGRMILEIPLKASLFSKPGEDLARMTDVLKIVEYEYMGRTETYGDPDQNVGVVSYDPEHNVLTVTMDNLEAGARYGFTVGSDSHPSSSTDYDFFCDSEAGGAKVYVDGKWAQNGAIGSYTGQSSYVEGYEEELANLMTDYVKDTLPMGKTGESATFEETGGLFTTETNETTIVTKQHVYQDEDGNEYVISTTTDTATNTTLEIKVISQQEDGTLAVKTFDDWDAYKGDASFNQEAVDALEAAVETTVVTDSSTMAREHEITQDEYNELLENNPDLYNGVQHDDGTRLYLENENDLTSTIDPAAAAENNITDETNFWTEEYNVTGVETNEMDITEYDNIYGEMTEDFQPVEAPVPDPVETLTP